MLPGCRPDNNLGLHRWCPSGSCQICGHVCPHARTVNHMRLWRVHGSRGGREGLRVTEHAHRGFQTMVSQLLDIGMMREEALVLQRGWSSWCRWHRESCWVVVVVVDVGLWRVAMRIAVVKPVVVTSTCQHNNKTLTDID